MQLFVLLLLVIIESGCTYNHCSRSVPQLIEGDGWFLSSNWFGEQTVSGHGLNLNISADNNDIKSELGIPHKGWKKHYPFTITAYINSIPAGHRRAVLMIDALPIAHFHQRWGTHS